MEIVIFLYMLVSVLTLMFLTVKRSDGEIKYSNFEIIIKSAFWLIFILIMVPKVIIKEIKKIYYEKV